MFAGSRPHSTICYICNRYIICFLNVFLLVDLIVLFIFKCFVFIVDVVVVTVDVVVAGVVNAVYSIFLV